MKPDYYGYVFFESGMLIITFVCAGKCLKGRGFYLHNSKIPLYVSSGKWMEAKAKSRTTDVVQTLMGLGEALFQPLEPFFIPFTLNEIIC